MPCHCCVPGCKSNYTTTRRSEGYVTVFRFPRDEPSRNLWLKNFPRSDWKPSPNSTVCVKHFAKDQIISEEKYKDRHGIEKLYPCDRPKLAPGSVPSIFPPLPSRVSTAAPTKKKGPRKKQARRHLLHEIKVHECLDSDLVGDFKGFRKCYKQKLSDTLKPWLIHEDDDFILFYVLDVKSSPCVHVSIKINCDLLVKVYIKQQELGKSSLSWILPENCRIQKWSQIETILNRYISQPNNVTFDDVVENVSQQLSCLALFLECDDRQHMADAVKFLIEELSLSLLKENSNS